jgi:hypothetical protein
MYSGYMKKNSCNNTGETFQNFCVTNGDSKRRTQRQVISELNYPTTGPQHAARKPHDENISTNQLSSTPEDQSDQSGRSSSGDHSCSSLQACVCFSLIKV